MGPLPPPLLGVPYSSHIPSCPRLGYLPCPTATPLQALLSPGSSSPLPQPSLPFPSLSWKLAILSIFPLFFLPAWLQIPPPCPEGSVPYLWGRIRGEPAAIAPSPRQPPSFACGTAPVGCCGVLWGRATPAAPFLARGEAPPTLHGSSKTSPRFSRGLWHRACELQAMVGQQRGTRSSPSTAEPNYRARVCFKANLRPKWAGL